MYRLLLRLLPRRRRDRFGDEMAQVFAEQRARVTPGRAAVLWMKESVGLVRFGVREWYRAWTTRRRATNGPRHGGGRFRRELLAAWRGVRARRWRAAFTMMLLGLTLGANTIVFSTADSLVFHRS